MNRKERRAALARRKVAAVPPGVAQLLGEANQAYGTGQAAQAEAICREILTHAPDHVAALNLLGLIHQSTGRHRTAVKMFAKAIAANDLDAACHYNIASSFQLLGERKDAAAHFNKALALGLSGKLVEDFVMQNGAVAQCVQRTIDGPRPTVTGDFFSDREIAAVAEDVFLQCALQSRLLRGVTLEFFLRQLRRDLLHRAEINAALHPAESVSELAALLCALAQQCFINEYVYAQSEEEIGRASRLRELVEQKLTSMEAISPLLLAAVASYFPLYSLGGAQALPARKWPQWVDDLLRQQVREPTEEAQDCRVIPALTPIEDDVSLRVMRQYEENPFPRWTTQSLAIIAGTTNKDAGGAEREQGPQKDILVAGCGTGKHVLDIAEQWPNARILAIDISRPSLAYARRKTREAGSPPIEYAQADILRLQTIGRSFDRIEAVGVLHHLAEPDAGWRVLLALLKPDGILRVGLYSELARRSIVEARALISAQGFSATVEGIRALRQMIIGWRHEPRWKLLLDSAEDFYSMSGCRDLLFNVMEHRFTIPDIAATLNEHQLSFLGFELRPDVVEKFQQQYRDPSALTNLDDWHKFETENPQAFRNMYVFSVRKRHQAAG